MHLYIFLSVSQFSKIEMSVLRTDSPLSRQIVRAFLDFLDSVEAGDGVDAEGLEVARECLIEAFKLGDERPLEPGLLLRLFRSLEEPNHHNSANGTQSRTTTSATAAAATTQVEDWTREPNSMGMSKDELFGQFFAALEEIHFFKSTADGNDDPVQLDKATCLFHDALNEMEKTGCQSYDQSGLAEALKSQGNRAMQSKLYSDATELYSCAISLCENNAVYYCNRAAAYTQVHKYTEAISDCLKSIDVDPNYSKAYSRLGLAYYAQGKYRDAIDKGFRKALQLDPHNESVKENIRVAEQKLKEEQQRKEWDQNADPSSRDSQEFNGYTSGGSGSQGMPPLFSSNPFAANANPADFTNILRNMATNAFCGDQTERQGNDGTSAGSNGPEIRVGGNIGPNLVASMPQELRGAMRSMMEMFSGATGHGNSPQGASNGGSPAN